MTRRSRIVLWTSAALLTLFAVAVLGVLAVTQTDTGRAQIRNLVVSSLRSRIHGSLYVGKISDGFFTGLTVDSLSIRDSDDSLFIATGPVTFRYDLRDLIDRRVLLRGVVATHPVVYIRQHENGEWNFRRVFKSSPASRFQPKQADPFIVIDSAVIRNATFMLTLPWHASPHAAWCRPRQRDQIRARPSRPRDSPLARRIHAHLALDRRQHARDARPHQPS